MASAISTVSFISALLCRRCGALDVPIVTPGTGPHAFRANCGSCGSYIKFLPTPGRTSDERAQRQEASRMTAMAKKPASHKQLAYLRKLHDPEPPPATMAEASERIQALVVRKAVDK